MQNRPQKTAIILGATGLTGSLLLEKLIADERYVCIKLFSRTAMDIKHQKVQQYIGDMLNLSHFKADFSADEVYCCIGTTRAKTPDKQQYKAIDYGIPVQAAKLAKENAIPFFAVISAMGANAHSRFFYNRTKGQMEQAVCAQNIPQTYILRPSLIIGKRGDTRLAEQLGGVLLSLFNPLLIGRFRDYRSIKAPQIAQAMSHLSQLNIAFKTINSAQIEKISKNP